MSLILLKASLILQSAVVFVLRFCCTLLSFSTCFINDLSYLFISLLH